MDGFEVMGKVALTGCCRIGRGRFIPDLFYTGVAHARALLTLIVLKAS